MSWAEIDYTGEQEIFPADYVDQKARRSRRLIHLENQSSGWNARFKIHSHPRHQRVFNLRDLRGNALV